MANGGRNIPLIKASPRLWIRIFSLVLSSLAIIATVILEVFNNDAASPEWRYTAKVMFTVCLPLAALGLLIASGMLKFVSGKYFWPALVLLLAGTSFILIPLLSPDPLYLAWHKQFWLSVCWLMAFLCFGVLCFILGATHGAAASFLACLAGSILLGFGMGELWFLCTDQPGDWITEDQEHSKYLAAGAVPFNRGQWIGGICGAAPAAHENGNTVAHHQLRKDLDLFDVKYTFNKSGHRILPQPAGDIEHDLMLFGCSFTFGHGLEDDQTWPYIMTQNLGSGWRVENYAQSGYGAMQMLCMLENAMVPAPHGRRNFAVFLAINHHLRRNDFFLASPHYETDASGTPQRSGAPRYGWLTRFVADMKGSQLARQTGIFLEGLLAQNNRKFKKDYLAMLVQSGVILKSEYNTRLFVLLWPDLEDIAPELEAAGLSCIFARQFLPDWGQGGEKYFIKPPYEGHPNAMAAELLGRGLAEYFKKMVPGRTGENDAN